jgi:hypothetical protein
MAGVQRNNAASNFKKWVRMFWARARKEESCWVWEGGLSGGGYGIVTLHAASNRKTTLAHRVAYTLTKGPIPKGYHVDHLCRNRLCVNPDHLEAVTQQENNLRALSYRPSKTHCPKGHPYDEANTYIRSRGANLEPHKECRACWRAASRKAMAKRRAERHQARWGRPHTLSGCICSGGKIDSEVQEN